MYKSITILFVVCFGLYIFFTRTPDFSEADTFTGVIKKEPVKETNGDSTATLQYVYGRDTMKIPITDWYRAQVHDGQMVAVIYNPDIPTEAAVYSFFGYWIKVKELVVFVVVFILLFLSAVFITGKNPNTPYTQEDLQKKRKYKS